MGGRHGCAGIAAVSSGYIEVVHFRQCAQNALTGCSEVYGPSSEVRKPWHVVVVVSGGDRDDIGEVVAAGIERIGIVVPSPITRRSEKEDVPLGINGVIECLGIGDSSPTVVRGDD